MQVLDGVKDHLYAAGYTDTMYPFVIDYTWKSDSLASTMVKVKKENEMTFTGEGTLATVEIAKDFEVVKQIRHQTILRILWYVFQASLLLLVNRR